MARPIKQGLDYFPLDTVFDEDVKMCIALYNSKFPQKPAQSVVIGTLIILYQKIYFNNFYIEWNNKRSLLTANECWLALDEFETILNSFLDEGIFNKTLFDKYQILTSKGIQKRYFEIAKRRNVEVKEEYLLLNELKKRVNVAETGVFVAETGVFVNNNATKKSKEKESKENKNKLNKTILSKFKAMCESLKDKMNPCTYNAWFESFSIEDYKSNVITASVSSKMSAEIINDNYFDVLSETVKEVFDKNTSIIVIDREI